MHQTSTQRAPGELSNSQLEAELIAHAAWESTGTARMLAVLDELDRREAWADWQCRNAQQWLSWKCGLGYTAATERLRVARALRELPTVAERLATGRLSWSKVRELTRVATPVNEERWCDLAEMATAAQVVRLTRATRRISRTSVERQLAARRLAWNIDDDGGVTISVTLPADRAHMVLAAVRAATTPERGVPWSRSAADTLVELVTGDHHPRTEVVVHRVGDRSWLEDGTPIHPAIADTMSCDGNTTTLDHHHHDDDRDHPHAHDHAVETDRHRCASPAQRRWLTFRHQTCQFPGCHHDGKFEAHHVIPFEHGGPTKVDNLVRVCWFHHRAIHVHDLHVALGADRSVHVTRADGSPLDRLLHVSPFVANPPDDPAMLGQWAGDPLDLDFCLHVLGHPAHPAHPADTPGFSAEKSPRASAA
jgi:hypothetical protein